MSTSGLEQFLDALHAGARRSEALRRLAIVSRLLLAMAFIPTGMVKVLGHRFTTLPMETPVGFFFEAMYRSGWYWNFIGWGQVIAALLLLVPRTATLGALMFLPILVNVTAITWSVGFAGTVYITSLMLLANVFLVCWDYDRWRGVLFEPTIRPAVPAYAPIPTIERAGYALGFASALFVLFAIRSLGTTWAIPTVLGLGGLSALLVAIGWIQASRRKRAMTAA